MSMVARMRALYRRGEVRREVVRWRDVELRPFDRLVLLRGEPVRLTNKEYEVLALLLQNPGRVFTRSEILERIWGLGAEHGSNVVDVYVRTIRSKLGDDAVETVRGTGYRAPV